MFQLFMLSISFLLPIFITKCYDLLMMTDEDKIKKIVIFDEKYKVKKNLHMIVISCACIIIGLVISPQYYSRTISGIGLGGLILLLYTLFTNWYFYALKEQVIIIGISLFSLIIIGTTNIMPRLRCV